MSLYKTFGIYGIRNKVNGMTYVGQTSVSFGDRRDCHYASLRGGYGANPLLQADWDTYGEDAFEFIVLQCCSDVHSLDNLERLHIAEYKSKCLCYNIGDGGSESPWKGKHLSDDTKRKIGEKNRVNMTGRKASSATKKKMGESQKRRWDNATEEERAEIVRRLREGAANVEWSDDRRRQYAESQREHPHGATHSADEIRRMRQMYEDGLGDEHDIASMFNVTVNYARSIIKYQRWKSI